jgi:hypothetical protein
MELAKDFEPGEWVVGDDEYFADRSHVSRSMFSVFLQSPTLYQRQYVLPREEDEGKRSAALRKGTAVHLALLSPHLMYDLVTVEPVADKRTAAGAQQWQNHQKDLKAGKMPLSVKEFEDTNAKAGAILEHEQAKALLAGDAGVYEMPIRWIDKASGLPLKAKLDRVIGQCIPDVKTTSKARNIRQWAGVCKRFGYDIQAAWYVEGAKQALKMEDPTFVHVVVTEAMDVFTGYFPKDYLKRLWEETIQPDLCRLAECYGNDSWATESAGIVEIPFE